jgi:ribose-phosphate pyrophosphokinase
MICALPGNEAFAARLQADLGVEPLGLEWRRFPDGESYLRFKQELKGREVALVCTLNDSGSKTLTLLFAARAVQSIQKEIRNAVHVQ